MNNMGVASVANVEEKICTSCKEPLPREMFDESDLSKDGLTFRCQACVARFEENRESARRKAAEEAKAGVARHEYVGVRGGLLIAGYVK